MISSILISSDNFWTGGRETFIKSYSDLCKQEDINLYLLVDQIANSGISNIFEDHCWLMDKSKQNVELGEWITRGGNFISNTKPDLIWAQHYRTLPAWLLSVQHRLPLVTTIHGPLLGVGRVATVEDAIGVTLALHRGAGVTAVSQEIVDQLIQLDVAASKITLIPNSVSVGNNPCVSESGVPEVGVANSEQQSPAINCVMLTRAQKLEHIRAGVCLFAKLRKRMPTARLTIYSGINSETDAKPTTNKIFSLFQVLAVSRKLGRRWLLKNIKLINALPYISMQPLTAEPEQAIQRADIVFGMGRVVLEAMALERLAVLIGYQTPIGLVTEQNFDAYQTTNFSGREQTPKCVDDIVQGIVIEMGQIKQTGNPPLFLANLAKRVDVRSSWKKTKQCFIAAQVESSFQAANKPVLKLIEEYQRKAIGQDSFLTILLDLMTPEEKSTLKQLLSVEGLLLESELRL